VIALRIQKSKVILYVEHQPEFVILMIIATDIIMTVLMIRKKPTSTICRESYGVCDESEYCDGYKNDCPTDIKKPTTTVCRPAISECDQTEYCNGQSNSCPPNKYQDEYFLCNMNNFTCYQNSHCNGRGACVGGLPKCPKPALDNAPTIYNEYNPSGKVTMYSAVVNGVSSIVVSWTANTGYQMSAAHLYIGTTAPIDSTPASFPYSFTSMTKTDKFQMVVAISSISGYSTICDQAYFVSLEIDTIAESGAVCGENKYKELDNCYDTQGMSWLKGNFSISNYKWGGWYDSIEFCCCFDSTYNYDPIGYKTVIYADKNQPITVMKRKI
jgi:hypothetical protein